MNGSLINSPAKLGLALAFVTTISWGIWGAFIEIPEKEGFPATLGYVIWSLTMIPCTLVALYIVKWDIDFRFRAAALGLTIGLLGAGGQLLLFQALKTGPAYLVFPFVSLFPILTILLSWLLLKEKAGRRQWIGIILALFGIFFLSYQPSNNGSANGSSWIGLAMAVFVMWGAQAFVMKFANNIMRAEMIFFYMAISAILLVPFAILMTDFSQEINVGLKGPYLAFVIHILNSIGALTLVYSLRYGKAIVVVPLTGLAPIITVAISLILYSVFPSALTTIGVVISLLAIYFLAD
jgi:drug/metabolite transporter (DMT)-like permease